MMHSKTSDRYPNLDMVKRYVETGANVNFKNKDGATSLHLAIMNIKDPEDRLETVKYLVSAGADANILNPDGSNALHLAVLEGDLALVQLVNDAGARVDSQTADYGLTPLHIAVGKENLPIIQYLVETAGASVSVQNNGQNTAFMEAQSQGNHEISRYLLEHGAKLPQGAEIHLIAYDSEDNTDITGDSNSDIDWDDM